jgi:hypothetical protein
LIVDSLPLQRVADVDGRYEAQAKPILPGTRKLGVALLLGKLVLANDAPVSPAASVDRSSIRVKAIEVVVPVAVEFPWGAVKRRWKGVNFYANVAVLGIIYDPEDAEVARFSDMASTALWNFYRGPLSPDRQFLNDWELAGIPNRYTTQVNLALGNYQLQVVVTDGEKFGRVRKPRVEDASGQSLGISGIVLCKRMQTLPDGEEAAARAPLYVPLSGNGVEFSPAADIRLVHAWRTPVQFFRDLSSSQ